MDGYLYLQFRAFLDPEMRRNKLLVNQGLNKNGIPVISRRRVQNTALILDLCSTQAAFFDFDHDGDLDMFLINHSPDPKVYKFANIEKYMNTESKITGDRLYENRNGKFVDISKKAGLINNSLIMGLGLGMSDLNNDGWPDVYVCNDFMGKDALYLNNKNGTFTESSDKSLYHISYASMGNDLADFNNDGWSDIFTCEMMAEDNYTIKTSMGINEFNGLPTHWLIWDYTIRHSYNTLQMNNGIFSKDQIPVFSDIAQIAGISAPIGAGALCFSIWTMTAKKIYLLPNGLQS